MPQGNLERKIIRMYPGESSLLLVASVNCFVPAVYRNWSLEPAAQSATSP